MKKPRVHEVASDYAVDSSLALQILKEMGEFVKSPSSTIEVPVARKLRTSLQRRGYSPSGFTALRGEGALVAASFMQDLPRGLPRLIALLAGASDRPATALREALESRCLFFVSTGGHQTLPKNTAGQSRVRVDSLRGESGLMLLRNTPSRSEIVVWAPDRGVTIFQSFTLDILHLGTPRAVVSAFGLRQLKVARDGEHFVGSAEPFQRLAWAISSIPVRGQSTPRAEEQGPAPRQRKPESEPESTGPSLIYVRRPSLDSAAPRSDVGDTEPSSRAATRRWSVSGHWRNQWYPSAQDHARIWIEEHSSGAPEGEVVKRDRVFVVVPATTSPTRTTG